jgi:hypothetical protein
VRVTINGNELNVEVLGPPAAPVLIAHHGGGGIGSLAEPRSTFGPLADRQCCVARSWLEGDGCGDVLALVFGVRWLPVPAGGDRRGSPLVPAVRAVIPGCGGAGG